MAIKAINFNFTGATAPIASYDPAKTCLGTLIQQYTGGAATDKFVGPLRIGYARPMEQSTAIPGAFPHVIRFSSTLDLVFLADNSTAATTRRIILYEHNRRTSTYSWKGFITVTPPAATNHTIRGFRMVRELYTQGTVGVSGTAVTGTGSSWSTDRMSVGCRIGFGSTDPSQITTWYEISAIGSNTSITLATSAGTVAPGTAYVIEDLMCLISTSNATLTNGGLFVTKGLRYELFAPAGTTIPAAAATDNARATYWLADAASVTNTAAAGCALGARTSWIDQGAYVLDTAGRCFVYNFRKELTLTTGKDTTTNTIKTGVATLTGVMSQVNNGRVGTLAHAPVSGADSLFFVTTTRVYRSALGAIANGSTTWTSDAMVEIPPGGIGTIAAAGAFSSVEIAGTADRLVLSTSGAAGIVSYVTKYNTVSAAMDSAFLIDSKQQYQSLADQNIPVRPSVVALPFTVWVEDGLMHMVRISAVAATNQLFSVPLGAHWDWAIGQSQLAVTPKFATSDATKFYNVSVRSAGYAGSTAYAVPYEPFAVYYRTAGIDDNSGTWMPVGDVGDLGGISPGASIQFAIAFKVIGENCMPGRIYGLSLTYEDTATDSHYEPSVGQSSITDRIFAYRQRSDWGSSIPTMRIRLYNAQTGALILDDTTSSPTLGTFETSTTNGASWTSWNASADATGNYIRYTAASLPDGVRVRALLTQ